MINNLTIVGKIAFAPSANPTQTAATIHVNVQRNYKKEGEQYYPTDKVICKALSEQRAKMIMERFSQGDLVVVQGRLQKSDDYTNKDGQEVKGDWELIIDHIDGPYVYKDTKGANSTGAQAGNKITTPPAPKTATPPAPKTTTPPVPPRSTPPVPPKSAPPVPPRA